MNTNTETQNTKPKKIKKPQGPIRWGAVIPTIVIFTLVGFYFKFLFDHNLRSGLEWVLTRTHGAEVNVGYVKTSVLRASFETGGIQVTDKNQPGRNLFVIGSIRFKLLWDALLRAKFVIDDGSITGIRALSPRSRPGEILPPPPPDKEGPSRLAEIEKGLIDQTKAQYNDNILGDVASMLGGTSGGDQLKAIEGDLKASLKIKELETALKEKEIAWRERLKSIPQAKDIEALGARLKALKFNSSNPIQFASDLAAASQIIKEADEKVRAVSDAGKALGQDVNVYSQALKEVEMLVNQDLKDLQSRFKIPKINSAEFTKAFFMSQLRSRLGSLAKYEALAREYMPAKSEDSNEPPPKPVLPPERGQGTTYRFKITKGYPLFWLKHARIQGAVSEDPKNPGNIDGAIRDVTTDPVALGRPAILTLKGDFPEQKIEGLSAKVVVDHTTEKPSESLSLQIDSYPAGDQQLADSDDVRFIIKPTSSKLMMNAELRGGQIKLSALNRYENPEYDLAAKNEIIQDILKKTMAGIPLITVDAKVAGSWSNLDLNLSSNLGDELANGFKREIQAKIDEAQAKLKAMIDEKIGTEKAKLTAEFEKLKASVMGDVQTAQSQLEKAKRSAEAEVDKKKASGSNKLEEEGKKLLKGLGLGG